MLFSKKDPKEKIMQYIFLRVYNLFKRDYYVFFSLFNSGEYDYSTIKVGNDTYNLFFSAVNNREFFYCYLYKNDKLHYAVQCKYNYNFFGHRYFEFRDYKTGDKMSYDFFIEFIFPYFETFENNFSEKRKIK